MKFDPFAWQEVANYEEIHVGKGRVQLRCSAPCALFVEAQGYEALVGFGASFDVEVSEEMIFRAEGPKGLRVFHLAAKGTVLKAKGEVFTNIDRMPDESGNVLEVRRALRQLEIERRSALREIRAERDALRAERARPEQEAEPEAEPEGAA